MNNDPTEYIRREMVAKQFVSGPKEREELEAEYGEVWNTDEVTQAYNVIGFMSPFVVVIRREDDVRGTLEFQTHVGHRFYYNFKPA